MIGDVHGCLDELVRLLEKCGHKRTDKVILVGDLVGKGPDSHGVVAFVRALGARAVLGNHDAALLRWRAMRKRGRQVELSKSHGEAARSLTRKDWDYLESLPYVIALSAKTAGGRGALIVHAGFAPGVPITKQKRDHMLHMRSVCDDGSISTRAAEGAPWASTWKGPRHVIFGHDAVRGLQKYRHATGLDTGCVYGRKLTACILPRREIVSVPARQAYAATRSRD